MDTIINSSAKIDALVIIVDAEQLEVEDRRKTIFDKIAEYQERNNGIEFTFEIKVLVCNHCFESMLLGNEEIYPEREPATEPAFYPHYIHYNIKDNDPEFMPVPVEIDETIARYHFHYLHDALQYMKVRYNKKKTDYVAGIDYFSALISRINKTEHIRSFKELYDYIELQKAKMREKKG